MEKITFDARGMACPLPVVNAKKKSEEMQQGGSLTILVDNEISVQNLGKMADQKGLKWNSEKTAEHEYHVHIFVGEGQEKPKVKAAEEEVCMPDRRGHSVAVISSSVMGNGDDELGKILMKGFIYALSQPETILFYNGGVFLTTEGSDSLEDLKSMEAQGVKILSCGTCLNYYGLTEKLQVGSVTNMYVIAEKMAGASNLIRP